TAHGRTSAQCDAVRWSMGNRGQFVVLAKLARVRRAGRVLSGSRRECASRHYDPQFLSILNRNPTLVPRDCTVPRLEETPHTLATSHHARPTPPLQMCAPGEKIETSDSSPVGRVGGEKLA